MSDEGKPAAEDTPKSETALTQQQQALLQQQLQQQQMQLLQLQQQQLQSLANQNINPADLAAIQQQQLALIMMPMYPLMMPLPQQASSAAIESSEETALTSADAAMASNEPGGDASPTNQPAESLGFTPPFMGTDGFGLLSGVPSTLLNMDEVPKRKRGRPPKKDVEARAKAEAEKTLKQQFPMWAYGLPLLPGFPNLLSGMSNPGAVVRDRAGMDEEMIKIEDGDGERPAKMAKKKQRATGKPRGRPRTRPRPGEIIRRAKPLPIAPANYSVMYNYSLSNLAQRTGDLHADGISADAEGKDGAQDDNRLSASLLAGEHE